MAEKFFSLPYNNGRETGKEWKINDKEHGTAEIGQKEMKRDWEKNHY